jgi:hypothetical protein
MARRTTIVHVEEENRDKGKTFVVTEMDSESAEWWAFRVLQALVGANANISFDAPLSQLAKHGIKAIGKLSPEQAKPLLDEMMTCVSVEIPGGKTRPLLKDDIEEVGTRLKLRIAMGELHMGFFGTGGA